MYFGSRIISNSTPSSLMMAVPGFGPSVVSRYFHSANQTSYVVVPAALHGICQLSGEHITAEIRETPASNKERRVIWLPIALNIVQKKEILLVEGNFFEPFGWKIVSADDHGTKLDLSAD